MTLTETVYCDLGFGYYFFLMTNICAKIYFQLEAVIFYILGNFQHLAGIDHNGIPNQYWYIL